MSALSNLLGQQDDPRKIELVRGLIEKTKQGKVTWVKQANALTATLPNGYQVNFVVSPLTLPFLQQNSSWQLLTVRDRSGSELLRVSNTSTLAILAGGEASGVPLTAAANELFKAASDTIRDDLDRAIDTIKKL
ncbi:MAG TPA: hypothetical protein VI431_09210 [Candidatus Acidoferrum sp.]